MNLPEDRHPLLHVYVVNENPERVRRRCVSQGATTVLRKWPQHVTFSWMMAVVGLSSLLTIFLLSLVFLIASSDHQQGKRALIDKCERNDHVVQLVHMKNLEDLTVNENATYFVEIVTNESKSNDTACSVESYLKRTSLPVFLVSIFMNNSVENLTIYNDLEKKFKNFNIITFNLHSFFNKTVFANFQNQSARFLNFLAKVLVSWNVGGIVIDSNVKTLKDFQSAEASNNKVLTVGYDHDDVVLISAKRFCHVYVFDILKTITETKDIIKYSDFEIVKAARKRFCHRKFNCTALRLISFPLICNSNHVTDNCTFVVQKPNESQFFLPGNFSWENLCPITETYQNNSWKN